MSVSTLVGCLVVGGVAFPAVVGLEVEGGYAGAEDALQPVASAGTRATATAAATDRRPRRRFISRYGVLVVAWQRHASRQN